MVPRSTFQKELQAISDMFLGYLQFHQVTQDIQNNISLLGWMIYEDWEIQAWTYEVSHGTHGLLPLLPSPHKSSHLPGLVLLSLKSCRKQMPISLNTTEPILSAWVPSFSLSVPTQAEKPHTHPETVGREAGAADCHFSCCFRKDLASFEVESTSLVTLLENKRQTRAWGRAVLTTAKAKLQQGNTENRWVPPPPAQRLPPLAASWRTCLLLRFHSSDKPSIFMAEKKEKSS